MLFTVPLKSLQGVEEREDAMTHHEDLTRRKFLITSAAVGGGMVLGFYMPSSAEAARINASPWLSPVDKEGAEVNAWIVIAPDDTVTLRCAQSEMGEGVFTSMPMIVAEELQCDWNKVVSEYASANRSIREDNVYQRMGTFGSGAVRRSRVYLQQAGASARERLKEAAAQAWGVARADVTAKDSVLSSGNRTGTYAEFAAAAGGLTFEEEPAIKTPDEYTFLGTTVARLDTPLKVDGSATFGIDIRLPNMLYATTAVSPVTGGTLKSFDADAIMGLPGVVKVVEFGKENPRSRGLRHGVGVVADSWWHAKSALEQMPIEWDLGTGVVFNAGDILQQDLAMLENQEGAIAVDEGDAIGMMSTGTQVVEAIYTTPMQAHATMEPLNAVAQVTADRVDVWLGTQNPTSNLAEASEESGVVAENCYVHNCFLGGGYGGRGGRSEVRQAVNIAKELDGRPVKMLWSRETDMATDYYDPSRTARFRAALGPDGYPVAWHTKLVGDSIFGWLRPDAVASGVDRNVLGALRNMGYAVPDWQVEMIIRQTNTPVTFLRAPGTNFNVFMIESFTDELAIAADIDPVEYRRHMLRDLPEWLNVLNVAVAHSDWGGPTGRGFGRGVAVCEAHGTLNASVAEVSVSRRGALQIERIDSSVDCGHVINPLTVAMQTEGAIIYGLSSAIHGEITLGDGAVEQSNFDNYQMMRISEMPVINTHMALSGGDKWGGMGESILPSGVAAVANAIYSATGKRVRSIPWKHHDLSWG